MSNGEGKHKCPQVFFITLTLSLSLSLSLSHPHTHAHTHKLSSHLLHLTYIYNINTFLAFSSTCIEVIVRGTLTFILKGRAHAIHGPQWSR